MELKIDQIAEETLKDIDLSKYSKKELTEAYLILRHRVNKLKYGENYLCNQLKKERSDPNFIDNMRKALDSLR